MAFVHMLVCGRILWNSGLLRDIGARPIIWPTEIAETGSLIDWLIDFEGFYAVSAMVTRKLEACIVINRFLLDYFKIL